MSRPLPRRSSPWQRLLDALLRASAGPPRGPLQGPREVRVDEQRLRPRPDLLQSLGGRAE